MEGSESSSSSSSSLQLQDVPMTGTGTSPRETTAMQTPSLSSVEEDDAAVTAGSASAPASCQPEVIPELESPELEVGDHVYQWRSLCGVPFMFQHHGIVMDVLRDGDGTPIRLTIADFSNVETSRTTKAARKKNQEHKHKHKHNQNPKQIQQSQPQEGNDIILENSNNSNTNSNTNSNDNAKQSTVLAGTTSTNESETAKEPIHDSPTETETASNNNSSATRQQQQKQKQRQRLSLEQEGIVRTYTDTDKWHKVHYQSGFWKRQFRRSGTATDAKPDAVGLVLARVNYILQHPSELPDYHVINANCECVAFWCKTGNWSTLQASSFLELTAAGQAKQSATLATAATAATANVTVPAAGIWGSWFGYTTTTSVSWLSLHPMAMPGLACYAAITVGVPAVMYATAHKAWKETSRRLNDAFWEAANEHPEVFAECLTHWSEKG